MNTIKNRITIFLLIIFIAGKAEAGNWCKVIYNKETSEGELKNQLSKCKNSDNLFVAIHTSFINSGHLLNSLVAENCDLRREIITTNPRQGDPYFTAVCEHRKHFIR